MRSSSCANCPAEASSHTRPREAHEWQCPAFLHRVAGPALMSDCALCSNIIKFRRSCPLLGRTEFMTDADITWHENNWDDEESRFLAFTYHDRRARLCAF